MHAVSLTPHAHQIFRTTSKCVNHMQNSDGMQKGHACAVHDACGVIDTACTINESFERPWQPEREYLSKTYMVPNCPTPPLKKYINLKGLPNKKFSCMRCHWHRSHDFCVRKSIISRRIRSRIQKDFSPWIRGPGGIIWWKKPRVENLVTLSL
jgi:hypothetical protein